MLVALSLVASLLSLLTATSAVAAPAQTGPDQAQLKDLTAKVNAEAIHIHQLTEQLDQARLKVNSTSGRLAAVSKQHDATVRDLDANRATLLEQAVRAYMHGGATPGLPPVSGAGAADLTLGREYLRVASGDLANTADQLRQVDFNLRADAAQLQGAQQANVQATAQLQDIRTHALAVAAADQVQLDRLQVQIAAQTQVQTAVPSSLAPASPAAAPNPTQGLPVNNGLLSVVQQAAGIPVATPVVKSPASPAPTRVPAPAPSPGPAPSPAPASGGGGHAGGVWQQLRQCESGDNYAENTGNGYFGAYQFSQSTWSGLGYPGRPDLESPAMQDDAAMKLQAQSGWGQWPTCSAALGLK